MTDRAQFLSQQICQNDGLPPNSSLAKHRKMAISPFVFFRGTAPLFYADINEGLISIPEKLLTLPLVYVMGDCHTSNFGFFSEEGSHGSSIVFAPNDFDDACLGHSVWDLLRYTTALHLCRIHCQKTQNNADTPIVSNHMVEDAVNAFLTTYVELCETILNEPETLNTAITAFPKDQKLTKFYQKAKDRASGGKAFTTKSALAKATESGKKGIRFLRDPAKFSRVDKKQYASLHDAFSPYMDDSVIDIVQRHNAGTGSVELRRYYFLVGPSVQRDDINLDHFHIVEVKQQKVAAPLRKQQMPHPVNQLNPAHLTARCQRFMQRRPDLLLDEVEWDNSHWLVRSRHHTKVGLDPEDIAVGKKNVSQQGFIFYAKQCAHALALAHCRTDRRHLTYERAVTELLPIYLTDIAETARQYAQQVDADHQWFCEACNTEDKVS